MKHTSLIVSVLAYAALMLMPASALRAEKLVLLHTNDTHSQIDPTSKNLGGVERRKALIDSIRAAEPDVLLIDAGDMVQGTLFFSLYGGEVEQKVMNALGYDIQIMGNHEFDNGIDSLAHVYRGLKAEKISTNYDLRHTPLDGLVKPYVIKQVGDKRVGFIGINLDPKGMIADHNYTGLKYLDAVKAANSTAWHLKHNERVDKVVAITHIGYMADQGVTDPELVKSSEDIDLIIGGHSHTVIDENNPKSVPARLVNAIGDTVLVTQTGKSGINLGQIDFDLDTGHAVEKLYPVTARLDAKIDGTMTELLRPYRQGVDSLMSVRIGTVASSFDINRNGLRNLSADIVKAIGAKFSPKPVELSVINVGGIRSGWDKGPLTKGEVMNSFPFDNRVSILEISGKDLREAFDIIAPRGDGVSDNVRVQYDPASGKCTSVTIDGKPLDDDRMYILSTIDYLAQGGDYLKSFTRAKHIGESERVLYDDFISYISEGPLKGKKLRPDETPRITAAP